MKKLFGMTLLLFVLYFGYQMIFVYFQGGHDITYQLKDNDNIINIREILNSGKKNDKDNYSIRLTINDTEFNIQTFYNFNRNSNIVTNVKYYNDDNYECIFVKYRKDKVLNDVICEKNNIMYNYNDIKDASDVLKQFVSSLSELGYDSSNFVDNTDIKVETETDNYVLYNKNIVEHHFVGVNNANGFYRINSIDGITYVRSYSSKQDLNSARLNGFINDKYLTGYYDDEGNIKRFYAYNIYNGGNDLFESTPVSKQTYTLGGYDTSIYVYDPTSKKEYELDYEAESLLEVGNENTGYIYFDAGKSYRTKNINEVVFGNDYINDYENDKYEKIVKIGNNYGYYYLFEKVSNGYNVYRSDVLNKEKVLFLFATTNINNFIFRNEYIYYVENDCLKYYSDLTGNRTLLKSDMLNNNNTSIGVYIEK